MQRLTAKQIKNSLEGMPTGDKVELWIAVLESMMEGGGLGGALFRIFETFDAPQLNWLLRKTADLYDHLPPWCVKRLKAAIALAPNADVPAGKTMKEGFPNGEDEHGPT